MPVVLYLSSSSAQWRGFHQVAREYVGLSLGCDQDVSHSDAHLHSSRISYVSSTDTLRMLEVIKISVTCILIHVLASCIQTEQLAMSVTQSYTADIGRDF